MDLANLKAKLGQWNKLVEETEKEYKRLEHMFFQVVGQRAMIQALILEMEEDAKKNAEKKNPETTT